MRTEKATQARKEIGRETDQELLNYLKTSPDKTIYELHKTLGWSIGKIQKSLARLGDSIVFEQDIERGRLKKKYQVIKFGDTFK